MGVKDKIKYIFSYKIAGEFLIELNTKRAFKNFKPPKNWRTDILAPPLRTGVYTKEIIAKHYLEGRYVNGVKPVAWVTSGAPIEILKALGFYILYPENHGALCGARKAALEISEEAEKKGYSIDICSYARTDIGSTLSKKTPVGKLPKPDLLLCCTNICQTVLYWYRVLAEYYKVPLIVIDTPFVYDEAKEHDIEYVKKQLEASVEVSERVAKKGLSFPKLKEVVRISKMAAELWLEIMNANKNKPAPISVFDQFIHMAPIVEKRGDPETVDFYAKMLDEIKDRIKNGVGAVKNERKRVLWDNLPIWYKIRFLSEFLAENGVSVVASTYTNAWGELAPMMDIERPIESMAKTYIYPILNRGTGHKLKTMEIMVKEFDLDGAILHSDRSCKPYSVGQMDQRLKLLNDLGVAALLLEADHNDPRVFADEQVKSRLKAFVEMMD